MKITDAFLGEHGVFYAQFDRLEQMVPSAKTLETVQEEAALVTAALVPHALMENEILFPALEECLGPPALPVPVMRQEHRDIEGRLMQAQWAGTLREAQRLLLEALDLARDHFAKEEEVLFPLAEKVLGAGRLSELGMEWARRRGVKLPELVSA